MGKKKQQPVRGIALVIKRRGFNAPDSWYTVFIDTDETHTKEDVLKCMKGEYHDELERDAIDVVYTNGEWGQAF